MQSEAKLVDLFPYKIKNVNNFYSHRDHPKKVNPESSVYKDYYLHFMIPCIEGQWVLDEDTCVYMYPSLFFFVNYAKIQPGKKRKLRHPDLRDNEWIIHTYLFITRGFSGFELDEDYTCNYLVQRYEINPDDLDEIEINKIPKSCYKDNGDLKKFIDPWNYLTRHYLLDNKKDYPLGTPLYENPYQHGLMLTARSIAKSSNVFVGEFAHSFLLSEVLEIEDADDRNEKMYYGMGAAESTTLTRSLSNFRGFYENMPGQYQYSDPNKEPYKGYLYKNLQGEWRVGKQLQHLVKYRSGKAKIQGSILQMSPITVDNVGVFTGDRFKLIGIEEVRLLTHVLKFHSATEDSMKDTGVVVGRIIYLGTSGNVKKVKGVKKMFDNPFAYDIFGIPNYWGNSSKKIGLFLPMEYALSEYKDKNGNTNLELARQKVLKTREKFKKEKDSASYQEHVRNNPIEPKELLSASNSNLLPKAEISNHRLNLETENITKRISDIGRLEYDYTKGGQRVNFVYDNNLSPILEYDDDKIDNKEGAWIIYEQPPERERILKDVYHVLYDPAKMGGDGDSYHCIIVYKHFGLGTSLEGNIVAEWMGRRFVLEENYQEVIKAALFFGAEIFPEINVPGFIEYCKTNDYFQLLRADVHFIDSEIRGEGKKSKNNYNINVN